MIHHRSPIDMDTGLEIEYHDLNDDDDEMDVERYKRLNDATKLSSKLAKGMKGLSVDKDRRCRSYDDSPGGNNDTDATSSSDYPNKNYQRASSSSSSSRHDKK